MIRAFSARMIYQSDNQPERLTCKPWIDDREWLDTIGESFFQV